MLDRLSRHDLADAEWQRLRGFLPADPPRGGRWLDHRMVINGIFFRTRAGCPWRDLPEGSGNRETVCNRHRRWSMDGLRAGCDEAEGRERTVSADSSAGQRCYQHRRGSAPRLKPPPRKSRASASSRGNRRAWRSRTGRASRSSPRAAFASPGYAPLRRRRPPEHPSPSRREMERERVREAAVFCADSLSDGWEEAVADRATDYAQTTWEQLSRSRRKRNCKALGAHCKLDPGGEDLRP